MIAGVEEMVRAALDRVPVTAPAKRATFDVIRGHCVLAIDHMEEGPKRYSVFLRDPFQQFKSGHYCLYRAHWSAHHKSLQGIGDLDTYLDYRPDCGMDNIQPGHLSGERDAMMPRTEGEHVGMPVDQLLFDEAQ